MPGTIPRYHKTLQSFIILRSFQIFRAHTLSIAYAENNAIQWALEEIKESDNVNIKKVLTNLVGLYATFVLEKHLATLYIGIPNLFVCLEYNFRWLLYGRALRQRCP